jgi:hypothetical protein
MSEWWTTEDQGRAIKEGWGVFNLPYAGAIQRDDEQAAFAFDPAAVEHVVRHALAGSPFHAKAASIHFATEARWAELKTASVISGISV